TFEGRVVDPDGKALPGASLRITPRSYPASNWHMRSGEHEFWVIHGRTDHEGRYRVGGLGPGWEYTVLASVEDPRLLPRDVTSKAPNAGLDIRLGRGATLVVQLGFPTDLPERERRRFFDELEHSFLFSQGDTVAYYRERRVVGDEIHLL